MMKILTTCFLPLLALCATPALADGVATDTDRATRLKWFSEARFGMFIHFGAYSCAARGEWVKEREKLSDADYQRYVENFNPDLFDPCEWARVAKEAGMKYVVLTAKHHDGFCLYDSKLTGYKVTNTRYGKDIVHAFAEACRAEGLKVGLYYSLLDWHHPDYTIDYWYPGHRCLTKAQYAELNKGRNFDNYLDYLHGQVRELLTDYGKIDILWYDFTAIDGRPWAETFKTTSDWRGVELLRMTRELQPGIVVNDRLGSGADGDVSTPEQSTEACWPLKNGKRVPAWELCQTFSGNWGYDRDTMDWMSSRQVLRLLIDTCSKGGNLILNVGPTGRGLFDRRAVTRLKDVGEWMKLNGRSICGCTEAPPEFVPPDGTVLTYNPTGRTLYVHLIDYPTKTLPIAFADKVKYAQFLHDASEIKIDGQYGVDGVLCADKPKCCTLPVSKPDVEIPVIEMFLK